MRRSSDAERVEVGGHVGDDVRAARLEGLLEDEHLARGAREGEAPGERLVEQDADAYQSAAGPTRLEAAPARAPCTRRCRRGATRGDRVRAGR